MKRANFIEDIKSLCVGEKLPDPILISTGEFPDGWVEEYLTLLSENRIFWQNLESWPKDLIYCFFRVGFHIGSAYSEWCRSSGEINFKTEEQLTRIRLFTDAFIAGDASQEWNMN